VLIKLKTMMSKDQKGFTLIELVVVMAILAFLVALAIPRVSNVMIDSKFKAHNANVELLTRAVDMYNAQEGEEFDGDFEKLKEKYIKGIPDCPIAGISSRVDESIEKNKKYEWGSGMIKPNLYKFDGNKWKKQWEEDSTEP
jgi:type IV pilus assembly protein PilA